MRTMSCRSATLALAALLIELTSITAAPPDAETFRISTIAGTGESLPVLASGALDAFAIGQPFGVETGPDGALFVCSVASHRIVRVDLEAGDARTVVGNGERGSDGDGGPALQATITEPYELRFDAAGDLFFVDMRAACVRRVDRQTGLIERVAGTGEDGFGGDGGPAVEALLSRPHSIGLGPAGGLFIADIGNHRIRRVDLASGRIETIAGNGQRKLPLEGGLAAGAPLLGPRALWTEGAVLWVALREGHSVWRLGLGDGRWQHVAGSGVKGWVDGPPREARFNGPKGIVVDAARVAWVVDTENQAIRRIDPQTGQVDTVAGGGPSARGYGGDGGPARAALLDRPHGIALDPRGRPLIGDTGSHRVRRLERQEAVTYSDNVRKVARAIEGRGDPVRGQAVWFDAGRGHCDTCHRLEGTGQSAGPDLTGIWQRASLEALVEALVEPSRRITAGYETWTAVLKTGETLTGLRVAAEEGDGVVVLRDAEGSDRSIDESALLTLEKSGTSLMPAGLVRGELGGDLADLVAFLSSREHQEALRGRLMRAWLVGPFGRVVRKVEAFEAAPDPLAIVTAAGGSIQRWQTAAADAEGLFDLRSVADRDRASTYALAWLVADGPQEVELEVRFRERLRLVVGDETPALDAAIRGADGLSHVTVRVALPRGRTALIARVASNEGARQFGVRLVDGSGVVFDTAVQRAAQRSR